MCNKCNNIKSCECNQPEFRGCSTKLDLLCTYYSGEDLEPIGIVKGMDGTKVIEKISDYVENILANLDISPTVIENVGNGVKVYKELSPDFIDTFRTLKGTESVEIQEGENEIFFKVNENWIENQIINYIDENSLNNSITLRFSSELLNPGTPDTNPTKWTTETSGSDVWMGIQETVGGEPSFWKILMIKGRDGRDGRDGIDGTNGGPGQVGPTVITSTVFNRTELQPVTPTGGTYESPIPSGWSNTIPPISSVNVGPVWTSTRIFTSNGLTPQQSSWTTPVKVADSEIIDYEFSSFAGTSPGTPTTPLNGATWHDVGLENDRWMAVRTVKNGVNGVWSVVKIKGENGTNGQAGTGFSVVISNPIQSVAVGSDNTTSSELNYSVTIDVYSNSTQLSPMNSPLTASGYRIEVPTSPLTGIQVTKVNGNTLNYKITSGTVFNSQAITSMINVYAGLSETNLKTSFVIFPVNSAEDAESLTLSVDSNVIKFDGFGNLDTPTTVIARAQQQNYNETITWSSVPAGIVSGTGLTKTINSALFFQGSENSAKIRIQTPNGLFDETTIVKVQNGSGGAPGLNGTTGPIPRLLELVVGGEYENGGEYIDYAYYRSDDTNEGWYTVNVVDDVRTVVTYTGGVPSLLTYTKAPFQKEMSFGTVIAEQANLAGFIFRNQILNSQEMSYQSCAATNDRGPFPNLLLDGRQGIIKFLEKMVLSKDGIAIKDDCGKNRMVFMFENGVPVLKFFDASGAVIWEAGQNNFGGVTTAFFSPQIGIKTSIATSTTPPVSETPINEALPYIQTIDGQYKVKESNPLVNVYGQKYVKMNPEVPTLPEHNKVFTSANTSSAVVTDGWYMYSLENVNRRTHGGFTEGVVVNYIKIMGGVLIEYASRNYKLAASIVYRNYSSDLYGGSGDVLYATWIDKNGNNQAYQDRGYGPGVVISHSVCAEEGSYNSTGTIVEGGVC